LDVLQLLISGISQGEMMMLGAFVAITFINVLG